MRLSIALLALAGSALASPSYAKAGVLTPRCPYADFPQDASNTKVLKRSAVLGKKGVMYMNRIAPRSLQLYISNADGSDLVKFMPNQTTALDYHANWSPDGNWIVFTSERRGDGQSDIYRIKPDGSGLETLVSTDVFEDGGVLSPDGTKLAFVSTAINHTANVFVKDLSTESQWNITGSDETVGNFASPHGFFRPQWSPNGEWIALSSDANTDWTGHDNGTGWEHTQELSIYIVRPNGSDFQKVISYSGYSLGTPKWSPDGLRIVYNNMTVEHTYYAHGVDYQEEEAISQIFSVDVATSLDVIQHTFEETCKVSGTYIGNTSIIGYITKAGTNAGINYTTSDDTYSYINGTYLRNPSWSPDGSKVVYEIPDFSLRSAEEPLWSFDSEWEYRYMDVFPQLQTSTGKLVTTQKNEGNASNSALVTNADYSNPQTYLDVYAVNSSADYVYNYEIGEAGAFQSTWRGNTSEIAVGFGFWFETRSENPGTIYLVNYNSTTDSSNYVNLTYPSGALNAGFPSFNPEGTKLVYRLWDGENGPLGLRILDLETGDTFNLTYGWDNTPGWSPNGELIVFTRQTNWTAEQGNRWYADRYDVCTIKPDGTDLQIHTISGANDAHAVWSADNRIMYNSGMYGFRDEDALYDNTFQPYGQIVIMNADGSNKILLTDTMWEDSMPLYVPNEHLEV
jgi:Tol biopolymer transport system component